jgi:hypothetical protein
VLALLTGNCFAYQDGIRVAWDYRQCRFVNRGSYARVKKLTDNRLALVYDAGGRLYIRFASAHNDAWGSPVEVAKDNAGIYNYTNSELIELRNGTLLYAWNARPKQLNGGDNPYRIMIKMSDNGGATWTNEQNLYQAGNDFGNGCWEPAFLQLPSGELQIYFADESPYTDSNEQQISLLRSFDNGATWTAAQKVCFRAGSRDGMPVPVYLQDNKGIVMAIEDNGINGAFKPVIIHSSVEDNWSDYVSAESLHRRHALRSDCRLAAEVAAGAPYLIQLHSGETVLSMQSGEGRHPKNTHTHANMQVYIGSNEAKDFSRNSSPFPWLPPYAKALWSSLCQTSDTTVVAVSSVGGLPGQNGVWIAIGHIMQPLEIHQKTSAGWGNCTSIFVGAMSQASMRLKALWDNDSLYLRFDVKDSVQTIVPNGNPVWNSDGVEIFLNPENRNSCYSDVYKMAVNINGETHFRRRINDEWLDNPVETNIKIDRNAKGYSITLVIPWNGIGRTWPPADSFGIHLKLHNNDNGVITHDELSGGNPDLLQTWLKTTLLQTI